MIKLVTTLLVAVVVSLLLRPSPNPVFLFSIKKSFVLCFLGLQSFHLDSLAMKLKVLLLRNSVYIPI